MSPILHLPQGTAECRGIQDFLSSWNDLASDGAEREVRGRPRLLSLSSLPAALGGTKLSLLDATRGRAGLLTAHFTRSPVPLNTIIIMMTTNKPFLS